MSRYRRHLRWVAIALILFLLLEVSLRLFLGLGSPPLLQKDAQISYLFQANQDLHRFGNQVIINAFHQRSDSTGAVPAEGVTRILYIGDSVTFGGVLTDQDQTITEVTEDLLNRRCAGRFEVLNASAGSWGIGNMLAYLETFGTFGSRIVVLQIGSHDLLQPKSDASGVGINPSKPAEPPALAVGELVYRYLLPRLKHALTPEQKKESARVPADSAQFAMNMDDLSEALLFIAEQGARSFVLHTPNRNEVVRGAGEGASTSKFALWRADFLYLLGNHQVPVLNLADEWQGGKEVESYFRDGVHLSPKGNRAVARAFVSQIQESHCR